MALRDTVERLRTSQTASRDVGERVTRWQREVTELYDRIDAWLAPYGPDGGVTLVRVPKTITEERTGPYPIDQLDIEFGEEVIRLDPKATFVIGAHGRIDISHLGTGDPVLLVLGGSDDEPHWHLVAKESRKELTPLTKESFEATLEDLLATYGPRP